MAKIETLKTTIGHFTPSFEREQIIEGNHGYVESFNANMVIAAIDGAATGNFVTFESGSYGIISSMYRDGEFAGRDLPTQVGGPLEASISLELSTNGPDGCIYWHVDYCPPPQ